MPEALRKTPFAFLVRPVFWLVLAGLLAVYATLGFYALPRLLNSLLKDTVRTDYARELAVGEIRFNPFSLALEIDALGRARAEVVQEKLLGDTGIDPGRVFLTSPAEAKVENGAVIMELALR